jgi:invasion protein IalB
MVRVTLPAGHGIPAGTELRIEHGEIIQVRQFICVPLLCSTAVRCSLFHDMMMPYERLLCLADQRQCVTR